MSLAESFARIAREARLAETQLKSYAESHGGAAGVARVVLPVVASIAEAAEKYSPYELKTVEELLAEVAKDAEPLVSQDGPGDAARE